MTLPNHLLLAALRLLPKNLASRAAGHAAGLRLPGSLQRLEIRLFAHLAGVDLAETRDPIASFPTLQSFFTRALVPGARPIDPAPEAFVAPCDGAWGQSGVVERGTLLQVKGRPYSITELLGDSDASQIYSGGAFATFYLSPKDYHRFHVPCRGRVVRASYLPGALWPVNRAGVEGVDSLFARNERLVAHFEIDAPEDADSDVDTGDLQRGRLAIVAVGATMVGKVRVRFDDLTTNVRGAEPVTRDYPLPGHPFAKGEEWGRFEFGSTLVLVAEPGVLALDSAPQGTPLILGTRIGTLLG